MSSNDVLFINSDDKLSNYDEVCVRLYSDTSVEEATNRVFVVDRKFMLSTLKRLAHYFGLRWNFSATRYDRGRKCNRATRHGSRQNQPLRDDISITCDCDLSIRFRGICRNNNKISGPVVITTVNVVHSNTCDPSYVSKKNCHEHDLVITSVVVIKS